MRVVMRRCAATLVLALLACNGGDRGEGPLSGSAGLSAGESAGTEATTTAPATSGPGSEVGSESDSDSEPGSASESGSASASESDSGSEAESESDSDSDSDSDSESESESESDSDSESESDSDSDSGSDSDSDSGSSSSSGGELADGILDIVVTAHDDCTFTTDPASITVPEGTAFTVNWVSSAASEIEFDIAKIDDFNQVPIVIGMEPGTEHHDEVREWCGDLFTGTFDFRVTSCFDHHYIPVDCGG